MLVYVLESLLESYTTIPARRYDAWQRITAPIVHLSAIALYLQQLFHLLQSSAHSLHSRCHVIMAFLTETRHIILIRERCHNVIL